MKAVARRVPRRPELRGHGFAIFAKRVGVMVILAADKKFVVVLRILSFGLTRRGIPAPKYEVYCLPSIIKILLFQFVWRKYSRSRFYRA